MNKELLDTLITALQVTPENHILRLQVVRGLMESERWPELADAAQPLLDTEHRAFALSALSRSEFKIGDIEHAAKIYRQAIELDKSLVDEQFEAELEPDDEPVRLRTEDFVEDPTRRIRPYNGPLMTFEDVGGMSALKEQIQINIILPFQKPELYAAYGKKVGGGILMYGPPGCGKTHIARATAGEIGANFFPLQLNEVLSMWMGETEKQLNQLFETARAGSPAVIFIDEIDAIGAKRSDVNSSSIRWCITQLLTEMDGIASRNDELLVVGATNAPWDVDPAFRRPGRFDRVLFVPPPDGNAREEVLRLHARDRKIDPNLSWRQVAEKAGLFSGADLASLVDRACESALRDALKSGKAREVTASDFLGALREMRPSTVEWLRRAKNYVTYANQDGLYNELADYLKSVRIM